MRASESGETELVRSLDRSRSGVTILPREFLRIIIPARPARDYASRFNKFNN